MQSNRFHYSIFTDNSFSFVKTSSQFVSCWCWSSSPDPKLLPLPQKSPPRFPSQVSDAASLLSVLSLPWSSLQTLFHWANKAAHTPKISLRPTEVTVEEHSMPGYIASFYRKCRLNVPQVVIVGEGELYPEHLHLRYHLETLLTSHAVLWEILF